MNLSTKGTIRFENAFQATDGLPFILSVFFCEISEGEARIQTKDKGKVFFIEDFFPSLSLGSPEEGEVMSVSKTEPTLLFQLFRKKKKINLNHAGHHRHIVLSPMMHLHCESAAANHVRTYPCANKNMTSAWSARSSIICKSDSSISPSSSHTWQHQEGRKEEWKKKENTNLSSFYLSCHSLPLTFGAAEIPPADTIALGCTTPPDANVHPPLHLIPPSKRKNGRRKKQTPRSFHSSHSSIGHPSVQKE
jgi:hypothetical protein